MKPVFEDADENDFLLFNYLEGNLSAAEKKEVESELLNDVSLQTELGYWRESFVEADSYDTTNLESSLLMPSTMPIHSTGSIQIIIAALLASLLSLVPVSLSVKSPILFSNYPVSSLVQEKAQQVLQASVNEETDIKQLLVKNKPSGKVQSLYSTPRQILLEHLPILAVQVLPESTPDKPVLLLEKEIKIQWKKKPAIRTLSGKQRRQIARMKERALQRRIQNEFLKGRVPYVVPLNTNNF